MGATPGSCLLHSLLQAHRVDLQVLGPGQGPHPPVPPRARYVLWLPRHQQGLWGQLLSTPPQPAHFSEKEAEAPPGIRNLPRPVRGGASQADPAWSPPSPGPAGDHSGASLVRGTGAQALHCTWAPGLPSQQGRGAELPKDIWTGCPSRVQGPGGTVRDGKGGRRQQLQGRQEATDRSCVGRRWSGCRRDIQETGGIPSFPPARTLPCCWTVPGSRRQAPIRRGSHLKKYRLPEFPYESN